MRVVCIFAFFIVLMVMTFLTMIVIKDQELEPIDPLLEVWSRDLSKCNIE